MKFNNLFVWSSIILLLFLSMGITAANENTTIDAVGLDTNGDLGEIDEEYNARIIAENITQEYDAENQISIKIVDNDDNPIEMAKPYCDDDLHLDFDYNGKYYFSHGLGVGNHKVQFILDDDIYKAEPVFVNIKILKSTFYGDIKCKSYYGTDKDTLTMKATVYDPYEDCYQDGYVVFKVNGKSYKVKTKNGVATKSIKIKKAGTYTYTAKFTNENYKSSETGKAKLYVYSTSKKARTFNMGKYKVVLSLDKYKKLVKAKNTNKMVYFTVKTNKFIKQRYRDYYGFQKYKVKTVNARVLFDITYGGKSGAQGAEPNKYCMRFTTDYQYPDSFCTPSIVGYKQSSTINKLNSAKTVKW